MYAGNGLIPTFLWSARRRVLFVPVFQQTYRVVMMRMLLEGRTYDKLPVSRFLYPITTRKWLSMAKVMLLENVFLFLWTFTIIGAFIKPYSYRMVPYIVAENPNIGAREAISLSRRMMKGHKWECFVADLSFLGWWLLNLFTLGLSGIFYSNGYNAAFFVELLRACARIVQGFGIGGKRAAQRRIPVQQGLR